MIYKQKLHQKNRVCLILLDSTIEIAFKEFLVNESGEQYGQNRLRSIFNNRTQVHNEIKRHTNFSDEIWGKVEYYYRLRCNLIHERTTISIINEEINDFREVVQTILSEIYGLSFN